MGDSREAISSNPFATRFIRPGAAPYLFPQGQTAETIVDQLQAAHWWGEVVGPHGSGKSSLLAALMPILAARGRQVVQFTLRQGERTLPGHEIGPSAWTEQTQVVVDGFEQLSWWSRRTVRGECRRRGAGLLVTAHQPCGLPPLYRTAPTLELAQQVVQGLLPPGDTAISSQDVATAYEQRPGDLREMLFRLYDLYQSRRS